MVIWTPEQWKKELNEFAAAVRKKKFDKIPYDRRQGLRCGHHDGNDDDDEQRGLQLRYV